MKILLPGHEDTKFILGASSWLLKKYLPKEFDVYWLNYGIYTDELYVGTYVPLDTEQVGGSEAWASYLLGYVSGLDDRYIILGLDDYLINAALDLDLYNILRDNMSEKNVCGRLCTSDFYSNKTIDGELVRVGKNEYTCTAQWCIWNRRFLIKLLKRVTNPWAFEILGTRILNGTDKNVIGTTPQALSYADHGALSRKWKGINFEGVKEEDIKYLKQHGHI